MNTIPSQFEDPDVKNTFHVLLFKVPPEYSVYLIFTGVVNVLGHGCSILILRGFSVENRDYYGEDVNFSKRFGNKNYSLCYLFGA